MKSLSPLFKGEVLIEVGKPFIYQSFYDKDEKSDY